MNPLLYAVVGCAAQTAPAHISAIARLPKVTFAGMADLAVDRGSACAAEVGCPFFANCHALPAQTHPDVVVCTPHPSHAPIAIASLQAGAHVLVEKPIAVEVAEADAIIAAASSAEKLLAVTFQHRFDPAVAAMRGFIERGDLSTLIRVECVEPWFRTAAYYRTAVGSALAGAGQCDDPLELHPRRSFRAARSPGFQRPAGRAAGRHAHHSRSSDT
jgi:UDP-N-acetyl-2-amino-2-deoxyglucuronate dehydrogenase